MKQPRTTVLLVDPDEESRARVASELSDPQFTVLQAADATAALHVLSDVVVKILVTELYLHVNDDQCLIYAVRREPRNKRTRIVAHTHGARPYDRDWARRAGADAYLIKPSSADRVRYVVSRLAGNGRWRAEPKNKSSALRARGAGVTRQ
jgi:CheY-like chemotaxis protein